jgi:hypothetical protein
MQNLFVKSFESNLIVFQTLFNSCSNEELQWRERLGKWNLLEIVCHLYDEERDDFRTRLRSVLENPENPFPPIDPVGWVTEHNYAEQDFKDMLKKFLEERESSVRWLKSLKNPPLENTYMHPKLGPMSGKYILSNWLAHDYLHIKQIIRVKYSYLQQLSGMDLNYAGEW